MSISADADKQYTDIFQALEAENFVKMMGFMQDWMTNSKRTFLTSQIINCILRHYSPDDLASLPWKNFNKTLKALTAYNDRHFKRVDGMLRKSYILDFTLDCMGLMDMQDVGAKRKREELTVEGAKKMKES